MRTSLVRLIAAAALAAGCAPPPHPLARPESTPGTLRAFASEQELAAYYRELSDELERWRRAHPVPPAALPQGEAVALEGMVVSAMGVEAADESVTSTQHEGVDEGGIVKVHGDHLVMLRRGRLFTVRIGDGRLRPVSAVDAFGPGIDPDGAWYDELLVSDGVVVVIGYSYQRGGTEVGLFHIDSAGGLRHRSTWHLRSDDYYSSRNYASRLVGGKLIFYTPLGLPLGMGDPLEAFPGYRRWSPEMQDSAFRVMVPPTRVYRPVHRPDPLEELALHTVTVCDLAGGELACEGTAVMGPPGRVFYVSPGSVYVWTADRPYRRESTRAPSMVYRLPLDGSAPTALTVSGAPVDQFSFLESQDGHLNVLVRSEADGDGMWSAEAAEGDVALLRVPLAAFGDGTGAAPASAYRALPAPRDELDALQNRFVGDWLLYGTGTGWHEPDERVRSRIYAVRLGGGPATWLPLPHGVDRIERMGPGAVVVGSDGRSLHFSALRLEGRRPVVADRYTRRDASQGELRSHGFFYRAEGPESGLLGLPVRGPGRPGYEHLFDESASVLFLRNEGFAFERLGELEAGPGAADDACRASCVDWYGNARPLFLRGRIFALLGYEIVEGALEHGRIREVRRVSYAPAAAELARKGS